MLFDELKRQLSEQEEAALNYLESIGYQIMTEARVDDCKKKDGSRTRTFSQSGRYDLIVGMKSIRGRVSDAVEAEVFEKSTESIIDNDNFWVERDRWIRMNRDGFYQLVVEEALDDLQTAPLDVQEEVREKFLRFFSPNDWPL